MSDLKAWPKNENNEQINRSPLSTTLYRSGPASERHRHRSNSDAPVTPKTRFRGQSLDQSFLDGANPPSPSSSGRTRILDRKTVDTGTDSDSHPLDCHGQTPPSPFHSPLVQSFQQSPLLKPGGLRGSGGIEGNSLGRANSVGRGNGGGSNFSDDPIHNMVPLPPQQMLRQRRKNRMPPASLSASWSGETLISGLIHGPHFIPHILDDDEFDDFYLQPHSQQRSQFRHNRQREQQREQQQVRRRGDSLGSTWPPTGEGRAWWDSVKRVGVLSVLELERQIGLSPASLVFGNSTSNSSFDEFDDDDDDDSGVNGLEVPHDGMMSDGEVRMRRNVSFEGNVELDVLQDRTSAPVTQRIPSLGALPEATRAEQTVHSPTPPAASEGASRGIPMGGEVGTPPQRRAPNNQFELTANDAHLFENIYNAHPFAGAAFLRAFIACSFSLLLFHIHSFLSWPTSDWEKVEFLSLENVTRKWLFIQIPLRMEVQRALFLVSTARDTADATCRFRNVIASSVWKMNRNFGRFSFLLELCGVGLMWWEGMCWPKELDTLNELDVQIISINASNLLVFLMRAVLLLSLLYFVQVSVPSRSQQRRGLSSGTISRLRRITYRASSAVDSLTQCAVCLEVYEEGDFLMVLPCDVRHNFHSMCIEPWLQRMNTCPLCQRGVPDEAGPTEVDNEDNDD